MKIKLHEVEEVNRASEVKQDAIRMQEKILTCRICRDTSENGREMVRYGVRHTAHCGCFLRVHGGKGVARLKIVELKKFPAALLHKYGLLDLALKMYHAARPSAVQVYVLTDSVHVYDEREMTEGQAKEARRISGSRLTWVPRNGLLGNGKH